MRTVAVIALKGGSGKTTIAAHLALAAHRRGVETLLIDIDPQRSGSDALEARQGPGPAVWNSSARQLMSAQCAAARQGRRLVVVDTAAGAVDDVREAVAFADLAVLVVRPTLLDLAGVAPALQLVRRLGAPHLVVLNQALAPRGGVEAPLVRRSLRALDYMQAPVAPVILRSRNVYQTALERGRSAEEDADPAAALEIAALWKAVELALAAASPTVRRA